MLIVWLCVCVCVRVWHMIPCVLERYSGYYSRSNVCVAGHCLVTMADGSRVRADALRRGDRVASQRYVNATETTAITATVRCIVRSFGMDAPTSNSGQDHHLPMVQLPNGLLVTPWYA